MINFLNLRPVLTQVVYKFFKKYIPFYVIKGDITNKIIIAKNVNHALKIIMIVVVVTKLMDTIPNFV
jgi:hypothetical protein